MGIFVLICLFFIQIWLCECEHSTKKASGCLESFLKDTVVQNLQPDVIEAIKSRSAALKGVNFSSSSSKVKLILDATLGSAHSLFHFMAQLNVTGVDPSGNITQSCVIDKIPSDLKRIPSSPLIYINAGQLEWLHLLEKHPHALVLVNDMQDSDWHEYLHPVVRVKPVGSLAADHHLYSSLSFSNVVLLRAAYRTLVTCAVPPAQLLSVDVNQTPPSEYWTRLTKFLGMSLSASVMKQLIRGGVSAPVKMNEVCSFTGHAKCGRPFWDVSPSVCELAAAATHQSPAELADAEQFEDRLDECAVTYSREMSSVLGSEAYGSLLLSRMREVPSAVRRADRDTRRLIIDAGPGTTGTRTLHLVMSQLNITARHFKKHTNNCAFVGYTNDSEIDSDMKMLLRSETEVGPIVYWGDTPASERWWHVLRQYPKTRILMTDVRNDSAWLVKRLTEHCSNASSRVNDVWSPCTIPVPVGFDRWTPLSLKFHRATHVSVANDTVASGAFEAFRRLVRCAVPAEQLMWMYMSEQNNSSIFWNRILSFVNIPVSAKVKETLIAAGVPRWSTKGCFIGEKKCSLGKNGKSPVDPSVCTIKALQ